MRFVVAAGREEKATFSTILAKGKTEFVLMMVTRNMRALL